MALFNSTDLDLLNNEERDDRTYQLATCYLKTNDLREAAIWFETLRANSPKMQQTVITIFLISVTHRNAITKH